MGSELQPIFGSTTALPFSCSERKSEKSEKDYVLIVLLICHHSIFEIKKVSKHPQTERRVEVLINVDGNPNKKTTKPN